MRLRKTLPADIEQIIASGDVEAVARAVERCEIGAYLRGSAYEPRLMHFPASEEITDFLLARGEDTNSRDRYERTPIHARVRSRCLDQIPLLIARGGDINARDTSDQTALFGVVERFSVSDVEQMIAWGADPLVTADSRVYGKAAPTEYALHRSFLEAPRALFGVEQREAKPAPVVGERLVFDAGATPMRVLCRLWDQLVPDSGQCQTVQGEVIRIAGRVGYEVYDNGGVNWDHSFGALLDQYLSVVRSGLPIPPSSVACAEAAVASLKSRSMSHQAVDDITELAVEWVRLNPVLVEMDVPDVGR